MLVGIRVCNASVAAPPTSPITSALTHLKIVNGQPRNDALTSKRVDACLRGADQKADRGAVARTVLLEPQPRRNDAA